MKKFLIILAILQFSIAFAYTGKAFRYKVNMTFHNLEHLEGYIYYYTFNEGFDNSQSSFRDYFLSSFDNKPIPYLEIKSVSSQSSITLDFSLAVHQVGFLLDDISDLKLIEHIEFHSGKRIFIVEPTVYHVMSEAPIQKERIYYDWMENSEYLLFNWSEQLDLNA